MLHSGTRELFKKALIFLGSSRLLDLLGLVFVRCLRIGSSGGWLFVSLDFFGCTMVFAFVRTIGKTVFWGLRQFAFD